MKKKRILAACLSTFMTISSMVTPFLSVPAYAAETHNSFTENGTSDIPISCEVKSGYKVVLPAQVALDKDTDTRYTKSFSPGVIGNIDYDKFVIVRPKDNFYALNDVLSIRSVEAEVSQNDVSWSADELGSGESIIEKDASTEAELNLAGSYSGEIQYEFFLSNEDVEPANTSGLQLSVSGVSVSENETINVAMGSSVNIEATMNGEAVDNSQIEFETDNEHVQVDPDGDIVISSRAIPGETATITASINTNVAKANNVLKYLDKAGILSNVCAAPKTTTSFTVKVIDIHMSSEDLTNIDTLTVHPGNKVIIEANVEPADADVDVMWTKTCVGGALTKISNNSARLTVANDAEIGSSFDVIANIGSYAKLIKIKVDHEYSETTIPATCTEKGAIIKTCSCGKEERTEIPATGHAYGSAIYNWSDDKLTCTASRTCSTCSHVDTETVNTTNKVTTAATCTEAGVRTYTAIFTNSAFKTQTTTVAVSAVGHKSVSANNAVVATCTTAGKESDTKCSVCGVTLTTGQSIPATGHAYGSVTYNWSDDKSTCTASRTCSTCSHVDTETVNTTNEVTTAATCTEAGVRTYTATFTNSVFKTQTTTVAVSAVGHKSVSANNAVAATCTTAGKESDTKCSVCGVTLTTGQSIPALGHSYGEYTVTKAATCTEDGSKARTCSVCGNVDTAVVTKLGHDYASTFTVDKVATCTEDGSKSKHCNKCDSKSEITSIPATGHTYGSVTYNWADDNSTCTASTTCNVCSHVDTETVNTTNEVTTAATCTEAGVRTYTATFTNSAFKTQTTTVVVPATGHNFENGKCTICDITTGYLYTSDGTILKEFTSEDVEKWSASSHENTSLPLYLVSSETQIDSITKIVMPKMEAPVDCSYMFYKCHYVEEIDFTGFDTSNVTNMAFMFSGAGYNVTAFNLNLSGFDTSNVTNMYCMLNGTGYNATTFNIGDLSGWDTSNVTNMRSMFNSAGRSATTFNIGDLSSWDTSNVTNMRTMFNSAGRSATTFNIGDLSSWDTSNVTDMYHMFDCTGRNATTFNIGDLSSWNTSNVTDMRYMFVYTGYNATTFNIGDLSDWNISNVTNLEGMFYQTGYNATTFNIGDLSGWDTSNVTNMERMFSYAGYSATTFDIGDLSGWNISNVTNLGFMFYQAGHSATTWNIGSLKTWDTTKVTNMAETFNGIGYKADNIYLDLSNWNTSNVTNMVCLFNGAGMYAKKFYIGDISGWDTSKVTDMRGMFFATGYGATYSLNLSKWNVNKVTSHNDFNTYVTSKVIAPTWVN